MRRLGFWAGFVLLAAVVGGALAYKPWSAYLEQRRLTSAEKAAMEAAEQNIAQSESERVKLESRAGKEENARKHGYTKPGEKPLELGER